MSKSSFLFRQNDIRTKFYFFDIRLAMPLAYLGGKKTYFFVHGVFFSHGMHGIFYVILLSNSRGRRGRGLR